MRISPLISIFLIVLVDVLGYTVVLPLLPFYAERLGAQPFTSGSIFAVYALCQLISGPFLGNLSDRIGRRPVLLVSQLGTFIGFIVLANANALWLVFLGRIIDGLTAGNITVAQAYISDVTDAKNRARAFGFIGIAFGMGFLTGPAISGLMSQYGYQYPILASAGLSFLSILGTIFLLPKHSKLVRKEEDPLDSDAKHTMTKFRRIVLKYVSALKAPSLPPLLIQYFLFCMSFAFFVSGFALFAERTFTFKTLPFGPAQVGYVFAYSGFISVIIQGVFIGRLVSRFGESNLVRFALTLSVVSYSTLSLINDIPMLIFALTCSSIGSALLRPSLTSLISQKVGRAQQGLVLGFLQALLSVAQILAPMIGGAMIEGKHLSLWALSGAALAAGALLATQLKPAKA